METIHKDIATVVAYVVNQTETQKDEKALQEIKQTLENIDHLPAPDTEEVINALQNIAIFVTKATPTGIDDKIIMLLNILIDAVGLDDWLDKLIAKIKIRREIRKQKRKERREAKKSK